MKISRRWLLIGFGVAGTLFTIALLTALQTAQGPLQAFFPIAVAWIIVSGYTSINAVVKASAIRHPGPCNWRRTSPITVSIFGGTAESIALWLKVKNQSATRIGPTTT